MNISELTDWLDQMEPEVLVFLTEEQAADHFPAWTEDDENELTGLEIEFHRAGGRGVELAEQIDALRAQRDANEVGYIALEHLDFTS